MPTKFGGLIGWLVSTLILVAVGIFILARIRPVWRILMPPQG
ncbi:MAG TPA: hypothetical protein VIH30_10505 [Aquirhabdus sp.]